MAGSPDLSARISGTNEFSPGDDVVLPVVIQNTGLTQFMFMQTGYITPSDLPNTAKQLTVSLAANGTPLVVKSDPQIVGDLKGSSSATATFRLKIDRDAPAGTYDLPVTLNYTYMYEADQYGTDTLQYYYKTKNVTLDVPIRIKPEVQIKVLNVSPSDLNVATEGYVNLTVKNTGLEDGTNAVVQITRNDNSPVIPTEGSVYIGDFPAGAVVDCQFRVSVGSDAEAKTYPLDVAVTYKNSEGDTVRSDKETVGVPVGGKVTFAVTSAPDTISPGEKKVIRVTYKNTGDTTAYNVQARISAVDPFTSNDDAAFLGDMAPGAEKTASFDVSVDKTATVKEYGLDSEVRYRDSLDNTVVSDPLKAEVRVVAGKSSADLFGSPLVIALIIVVLIAAGYGIYRMRRKQQ